MSNTITEQFSELLDSAVIQAYQDAHRDAVPPRGGAAASDDPELQRLWSWWTWSIEQYAVAKSGPGCTIQIITNWLGEVSARVAESKSGRSVFALVGGSHAGYRDYRRVIDAVVEEHRAVGHLKAGTRPHLRAMSARWEQQIAALNIPRKLHLAVIANIVREWALTGQDIPELFELRDTFGKNWLDQAEEYVTGEMRSQWRVSTASFELLKSAAEYRFRLARLKIIAEGGFNPIQKCPITQKHQHTKDEVSEIWWLSERWGWFEADEFIELHEDPATRRWFTRRFKEKPALENFEDFHRQWQNVTYERY